MLKRLFAYAVAPQFQVKVQKYSVGIPDLPQPSMRIAVLSDFHAGWPWMGRRKIQEIVKTANALEADVCVLPGDFEPAHRFNLARVSMTSLAQDLSGLRASEGVYAVTGNHDWWEDKAAHQSGIGPVRAQRALEQVGIQVLDNMAVKLGCGIWLAGLGSQQALKRRGAPGGRVGVHDVDATLKQIADDAPVVLLAHEPDIFSALPERFALTISGHTHAGQIRAFGHAPVLPKGADRRYIHGHYHHGAKQLVVSAGLGCSGIPLRLGTIPEICVIDIHR